MAPAEELVQVRMKTTNPSPFTRKKTSFTKKQAQQLLERSVPAKHFRPGQRQAGKNQEDAEATI